MLHQIWFYFKMLIHLTKCSNENLFHISPLHVMHEIKNIDLNFQCLSCIWMYFNKFILKLGHSGTFHSYVRWYRINCRFVLSFIFSPWVIEKEIDMLIDRNNNSSCISSVQWFTVCAIKHKLIFHSFLQSYVNYGCGSKYITTSRY